MKLTPELTDVGVLLKSRAPLEVPKYQRGYAWEKSQIDDFIDDINRLRAGKEADHFFGTILTVRKHAPGQERNTVLEIVDGQQRTTTLVLALNAIQQGLAELARIAHEAGDSTAANTIRESAGDLDREYLWWKDDMKTPPELHCRLTLSQDDHDFFLSILKGEAADPTRASHKLLARASAALVKAFIRPVLDAPAKTPEERAAELKEIRNSIVKHAQVLNLTTETKSAAYRLFAILNDRGKPLSEADLLRTRTLELLDKNKQSLEKADRLWAKITVADSSEVVGFLRALYSSEKGIRPPSKNFFDALVEHYALGSDLSTPREMARVLRLVESLTKAWKTYAELAAGDWPYAGKKESDWKKDRLRRIVEVIRHKASIPLLLAGAQELPEKKFGELVQRLELFLFRYVTVCKGHPSVLGDELFAEAKKIRELGTGYELESLGKILAALLRKHAPDAVFVAGLPDALRYKPSNSGVIRHFLTTVADYKKTQPKGTKLPAFDHSFAFDFDQLDVEHIYAQKAKKKDADLEPRKHDIGNLTFWHPDDNRAAQNASFDDKRDLYADSKIRMTNDVAEYEEWTVESLDDRQDQLLGMASKIWAIRE